MNLNKLFNWFFYEAFTLYGGKGGGSAPAPDPNIGLAQRKQAELAEKQYADFQANIWPVLKAQSEAQTKNSNDLAAQQLAMGKKQEALTDQYTEQYNNVFKPLTNSLVAEANNYDTYGNVENQSALAVGDVNTAYNTQRQAQRQQMQAYGIDPTSGRYQGQMNAMDIGQGASAAAAATQARTAATQLGWNKKLAAAGLGAGIATNQVNSFNAALGAGNSSLSAGNNGIASINALGNSYNQGYNSAMSGYNNVGQLGIQKYNADINAYQAKNAADPFNMILGAAAGVGTAAAIKKYG